MSHITSTSNASTPIQKFRPSLSATQVEKILQLAKTEQPISKESMSLIAVLAPFQAKIMNAGIAPAYTVSGSAARGHASASMLESLGAASTSNTHASPEALGVTRQIYWEQCYNAYKENPAACSLQQIEAAKEWMYLNEMMSPEEQADFEASMSMGTGKRGSI